MGRVWAATAARRVTGRAARGLGRGARRGVRWVWRRVVTAVADRLGLAIPRWLLPGDRDDQQQANGLVEGGQEHPPVADGIEEPPASAGGSQPLISGTSTEVAGMLGTTLEELSAQMIAAAARYEPEGMLEYGEDLRRMPAVFENVATAFRTLADKGAAELPIHAGVSEALGAIHTHQVACGQAAGEVHAAFETLHEPELTRLRAPRPGEALWDVRSNQ
jgi:hypothetical protein